MGSTSAEGEAAMVISIVVPFHNEEMNVRPVLDEIRRCQPDAEIVAVDDCSSDGTERALADERGIKVLRLPRQLGQSAAIYAGLLHSTGDICVLMDGDGQCSAEDIKRLIEHFPRYDFVNGNRIERMDSRWRQFASRFANGLRNLVLRDGMQDSCGTPKAMKRECVEHLVLFDGLHRFIPVLLQRAGFKMLEIPVSHRRRLQGRSHYSSWGRGLRGGWDLIGVSWLLARKLDPRDIDHALARGGRTAVEVERAPGSRP
jgi:dolichol-phosphate mannosyltransferase